MRGKGNSIIHQIKGVKRKFEIFEEQALYGGDCLSKSRHFPLMFHYNSSVTIIYKEIVVTFVLLQTFLENIKNTDTIGPTSDVVYRISQI